MSVSDSNGNVLGSGTLYIHQPFEVTAAGGTVSSVSVTENASVSADDELLVLEGTESSAEYEKLLLVRKARTETLQKLAQLARSPQIIAEQDGIVQDVNVAASGTTSSESSAQSSTADDCLDRFAHLAFITGASIDRMLTVDCFGEDLRYSRLTGTSRSAEKICVSDAVGIDLIRQRCHNVVLPLDISKIIRPELPVQGSITHNCTPFPARAGSFPSISPGIKPPQENSRGGSYCLVSVSEADTDLFGCFDDLVFRRNHILSALLTMINSCANGIAVVNIDNGYGAGYIATQINRLAVRENQEQ